LRVLAFVVHRWSTIVVVPPGSVVSGCPSRVTIQLCTGVASPGVQERVTSSWVPSAVSDGAAGAVGSVSSTRVAAMISSNDASVVAR
jgi:hypothetical protein